MEDRLVVSPLTGLEARFPQWCHLNNFGCGWKDASGEEELILCVMAAVVCRRLGLM